MKRHGTTGKIQDDAEVSPNAVLHYSTAKDSCLIVSGEYTNSTLGGSLKAAGWPTVVNSTLCNDFIGGNPVILDSKCFGSVRIFDNASLEDVTLNGQISISGDAIIKGWQLSVPTDDFLRIHAGTWIGAAPRFIYVKPYVVSECVNGLIHVGCFCKPATWWLNHYRLGARLGVDAAKIKDFIVSVSGRAEPPDASEPSKVPQLASVSSP